MSKQLVVISGLERGRVMNLTDTDIIQLGCSQTLAVENRFRDPDVARVHCEVQVEGDRVTVIDAGTSHGTFLNGKRISREELKPSDVLRIGRTELKFLDDAFREGTPAESGMVTKSTTLPVSRLHELAGRTIAHFKLETVIGTGHWGRVFLAQDKRVNNPVTIKVLRPEFMGDADVVASFSNALKVVIPLRHRNLTTHFGAGKAGAFGWIASEHIEGKSATQLMRRLRVSNLLEWRHAFALAVHTGRALKATQQFGIVHGNITPHNILIRDKDKVAVLTDLLLEHSLFSLGKQANCPVDERLDVIAFQSPERTYGLLDVDARTDIYSLGACVYGVLTGRLPFEGQTGTEIIEHIRTAEPIKPRRVLPSTPPPFEAIILKMLAKRPCDRFQSAEELVDALDRLGKKPEAAQQGDGSLAATPHD
jgi:serine/threonine protein kinase